MRAFVDKDTCISCGACVGLCSEVYHFDDDDKAKAIEEDIPEGLKESAREGAESCPVDAISIEE